MRSLSETSLSRLPALDWSRKAASRIVVDDSPLDGRPARVDDCDSSDGESRTTYTTDVTAAAMTRPAAAKAIVLGCNSRENITGPLA
jgi:hypothetical protein